jgi:hypothetical protein
VIYKPDRTPIKYIRFFLPMLFRIPSIDQTETIPGKMDSEAQSVAFRKGNSALCSKFGKIFDIPPSSIRTAYRF